MHRRLACVLTLVIVIKWSVKGRQKRNYKRVKTVGQILIQSPHT